MRVAPWLRPPFRCPRCAWWRRKGLAARAQAYARRGRTTRALAAGAPPPSQPPEPEQPAHQRDDGHGRTGTVGRQGGRVPCRSSAAHQCSGTGRALRCGGDPGWEGGPQSAVGRRALAEVQAPDAVVPDVHQAVAVEVGRVAAVRLPEVLPPDAVVPNVDESIAVDVPRNAAGVGVAVGVAVGVTVAVGVGVTVGAGRRS